MHMVICCLSLTTKVIIMLEWLESELAERRQKSLYRSTMLATHDLPGLIQVDGQWLNNFGLTTTLA